MKHITNLPKQFWSIRDAVIEAELNGEPSPNNISEIYDWLENDGWTELVDRNPNDEMVIYVAGFCENDAELRAILKFDDSVKITNEMRIEYTREYLKKINSDEINYDYPEITYCTIERDDGKSVALGAMMVVQPGGWAVEWSGVYADAESFIQTMKLNGYWTLEDIGSIDDVAILNFWN